MSTTMALSKPSSFLHHLKSRHLRLLCSSTTLSDLAADRRRRKRLLRMQPPLSSSPSPSSRPNQRHSTPNPNTPKPPDHIFSLTGPRLSLHNKILSLIRQNDLDEASLYTRHSVYSNSRPTIFTVNAVLSALLRRSRYSDFLSLHRFITQAGIPSNLITYHLILSLYLRCRRPDTALEHYKRLLEDAPFEPSVSTFRILVKGLVDNGRVEKAVEIKDEMLAKGFDGDCVVFGYLMYGFAKNGDGDKVLEVFEELKERLGGEVRDGIVFGPLMRGLFLKGRENEAMERFNEIVGEGSRVKMNDIAFNLVLECFCKSNRFDEALSLFDRMKELHNPPWRLCVNLGSYNVMADGYCGEGRFKEAVAVFTSMGEKGISPDILSFNSLIERLCDNGLVREGEELCGRMVENGVEPDEVSYGLLMDACFKEDRADDGAAYFRKMIDENLRPNLAVYNRLVEGLVSVGKIDESKSFFDLMVKKLKFNSGSYEFMFKTLCDAGKVDEVLKVIGDMWDEGNVDLNEDMHKIVKDGLRSEGREEEELDRLIEQKEKEKEEAKRREAEEAEKEKARARAAVASLIPSKLFGNKEEGKESTALPLSADTAASSELQAGGVTAETTMEGSSAEGSDYKSAADPTQGAA